MRHPRYPDGSPVLVGDEIKIKRRGFRKIRTVHEVSWNPLTDVPEVFADVGGFSTLPLFDGDYERVDRFQIPARSAGAFSCLWCRGDGTGDHARDCARREA